MKSLGLVFVSAFSLYTITAGAAQSVHRRHFGVLKFNDLGRGMTFDAETAFYNGGDSPEKGLGSYCVQGDSFEDDKVLANGVVESAQIANVSSEKLSSFVPGVSSRRLRINFKKLQSWGKAYRLANVTHNCPQSGISYMEFAVGSELDIFGSIQGSDAALANFESELAFRSRDLSFADVELLPTMVTEAAFRHGVTLAADKAVFKVPGNSWQSSKLSACTFNSALVNTFECDEKFQALVGEMDQGAATADSGLQNPESWINVGL